ncbi:MAG: hypothetical protein ACE5JG_07285 [Planctomycetota bacterium]
MVACDEQRVVFDTRPTFREAFEWYMEHCGPPTDLRWETPEPIERELRRARVKRFRFVRLRDRRALRPAEVRRGARVPPAPAPAVVSITTTCKNGRSITWDHVPSSAELLAWTRANC